MNDRIPVTILTGFLGAGKTTLLNRILSQHHGKRIAVIENEFGEIGIDNALVINADEEIFEMSNGCICCTVRGDLIRILARLRRRRERFDYVLVETTGLADPGPVAQTFFMDDEVREDYALDSIVTLVDALHVDQQLGRSEECGKQIAFADVILLNKSDLVETARLDVLESRVRDMNRAARVLRCANADVPVETVLGLEAFDLEVALTRRPDFLVPEYPFEYTAVYHLSSGRHLLHFEPGPDASIGVLAVATSSDDDASLEARAEHGMRAWRARAPRLAPPGPVPMGEQVELPLDEHAAVAFELRLHADTCLTLHLQHLPEEFNFALLQADAPAKVVGRVPHDLAPAARVTAVALGAAGSHVLSPSAARCWAAPHAHDDAVGSVVIEVDGSVDATRFEAWLGELLRERGVDLYRMKGFLSVAGESRRLVFQGVHMLFDCQPERPWGEQPRRNQLVFIGRELDAAAMRAGFDACLQ